MLSPLAAVIIPHYNDPVRLQRCMQALRPQISDQIEVVVVDNSSPETPEVTAPIRLLVESQKGAAHARNLGVRSTTAPLLLFLDSDCVPSPDWVVTALRISQRADVVGGKVTVFDETDPPRSGAETFEAVFAFDNRRYVEDKGFSVTANLLTRRDVFEAVGDFCNGVSEDLDWCHRATEKGFSLIYDDDLKVQHPSRSTWPELKRKWQRLTAESAQLAAKQPYGRLFWALRALAMPFSAIAHLPKLLLSPNLGGLDERLRGAGTLIRLRCSRGLWMLGQATRPGMRME